MQMDNIIIIKRFIVCADSCCKRSDTSYLLSTVVLPIVLAVVYCLIEFAINDSNNDNNTNVRFKPYNELLNTVSLVLVVAITIVSSRLFFRTNKDRMDVVFVYTTGIQLASVYVSKTNSIENDKRFHNNWKDIDYGLFLPINEIIDVVVTEVLLAHKVLSTVVFRVRNNLSVPRDECPQYPSFLGEATYASCEEMKLVEAFPGATLTYMESLTIMNEIKKAIKRLKNGYSQIDDTN